MSVFPDIELQMINISKLYDNFYYIYNVILKNQSEAFISFSIKSNIVLTAELHVPATYNSVYSN